jgi:hypothetical protein
MYNARFILLKYFNDKIESNINTTHIKEVLTYKISFDLTILMILGTKSAKFSVLMIKNVKKG